MQDISRIEDLLAQGILHWCGIDRSSVGLFEFCLKAGILKTENPPLLVPHLEGREVFDPITGIHVSHMAPVGVSCVVITGR